MAHELKMGLAIVAGYALRWQQPMTRKSKSQSLLVLEKTIETSTQINQLICLSSLVIAIG